MIIKFSYYNDEDFGLTAFSEIEFSQKEIFENKKNKNEYIKYLVTGIMEDLPYEEIIDDFLLKLEKIETGELKEIIWDGQAFQHEITPHYVQFVHTIFGDSEEYPVWTCRLKEYKKVLHTWKSFLELPKDLESRIEVSI